MPALSSAAPRAYSRSVALGRLERRGVPVGVVVLGLDVVVGVEQDGLRALAVALLVRDHSWATAIGAGDPRIEALGGEQVAHRLRAPLHLPGALRVGAHRLDPDQSLEVTAYARNYVAHVGPQVVGVVISHGSEPTRPRHDQNCQTNHAGPGRVLSVKRRLTWGNGGR